MPQLSEYEKEREANIAKNRALLQELDLLEATADLGFPASKSKAQKGAKPVQSSRPKKRKTTDTVAPRRQSSRLNKPVMNPDETPEQKRKRLAEEEERRAKEAEERLELEARERAAKRPRHHDLDLATLGDEMSPAELTSLTSTFGGCAQRHNRSLESGEAQEDEDQVAELKAQLSDLKIVSRAKVTQDRVYSALYHPEETKDLILFGDKHGQLGIWDARAPQEEVQDEDGDVVPSSEEGGKIFRLQPHWPATSKSSVSCIKLDPLNTHNVFTSAYDCTLRNVSFESGVSREVFSLDEILISSFDILPNGHEMWVSDAEGGLTHLDLRESRGRARRYQLSDAKIGLWDARKIKSLPTGSLPTPPPSSPLGPKNLPRDNTGPIEINSGEIESLLSSRQGKGSLMANWPHEKSVSSAYWDPSGRRIVSTCYDDTIRLWNVNWDKMTADTKVKTFSPFSRLNHNCQTGKWLTILKSQWNPNPNVYPHFTVGNMNHSLNIISASGDVLASLYDSTKISAVQAVTCSHPSIVARAASGNASGRCVLWAPEDLVS